MNFSKRQKILIVLSIWLFFLWIVVNSLVMRSDFKGDLIHCIVFSVIGMVLAMLMYLLIFVDKYFISKALCEEEDVKRIKSMKRTSYISLIYIDIIGFFLMTLVSLLIDRTKHAVTPAGFIAIATFVLLCACFIRRYRKIHIASRTFSLQEQNREITIK